MQSDMIKPLVVTLLMVGLMVPAPRVFATADDAPIKVQSGNFAIESFFFGNTGVVYSSSSFIPPVITAGPTVTNLTTSSATITWTTDKLSSSLVQLGQTATTLTEQFGPAGTVLTANHTVVIPRLTKGTKYFYRVRSFDTDGNLVDSAVSSFTTDPGDIVAPVITNGPLLSVDSASLVTITWETNEISSTTVEYGVSDVTENSLGRPDDLTLFHQVRVSGLQPSQRYFWRVKSRDASGNTVVSPTQTIATPNSPFISGFQVTDVTLSSAVVQWNTSTSSTTKVELGTQSATYDRVLEDPAFVTSHVLRLSGLVSGTTYYLRVSGVDQAGNVLQSDEKVFATIVIPQISNLSVSEETADAATVFWRSSSAIDELIRYEILDHPDKSFIGKKFSAGSDKLLTEHQYGLTDLEADSTYSLTVLGKDVFGNQAISNTVQFRTKPDGTPPELLTVRSDTTVDLGSRQTVQVLVSAECSELCKTYIEYGPGSSGPYDKKVETDTLFTRAKFMVIPGLQPGQTYHFRLVVRDRTGNISYSPDYLVRAPIQPISLLDLIFGQVRSNFGWLSQVGS
jgi:hypothetical protein